MFGSLLTILQEFTLQFHWTWACAKQCIAAFFLAFLFEEFRLAPVMLMPPGSKLLAFKNLIYNCLKSFEMFIHKNVFKISPLSEVSHNKLLKLPPWNSPHDILHTLTFNHSGACRCSWCVSTVGLINVRAAPWTVCTVSLCFWMVVINARQELSLSLG